MTTRAEKQADEERSARKTERKIHKGRIIEVVEESMHISGVDRAYDLVLHPGAVAIIAIDSQGDLVLVRQWRRAINQVLIEIPAGTIEPGEQVSECAQRELQEETGFKARSLLPMGQIHTCPGFCDEKIFLFLGTGLELSPLPADDNEAIDVIHMSIDEAYALVEKGLITDAKTIAAMALYDRWNKKNNR
jgi:ADP-ribose pyrophosphatase